MRHMIRETFTVGSDTHGRRLSHQATEELDMNHYKNDRSTW